MLLLNLNTLYVSVQVFLFKEENQATPFKYIICISSRKSVPVILLKLLYLNTLYVSVQVNLRHTSVWYHAFKYIICITSI